MSIFGEPVVVNATVHHLSGFSAHAGQAELLDWMADVAAARPRVVLIHGNDEARSALAARIRERYGIDAECPGPDDEVTLS